jgi:choline dehydrogenase-like flavoprotein
MSKQRETEPVRRTSWLSRGLESLQAELLPNDQKQAGSADLPFDVIIVGSGYGGAIVAAELAAMQLPDRPLRVCILERGREYLDGAFPERAADLAGHVRFSTPADDAAKGVRTGLFDLRLGPDVCALLANGLGGGSLINAGVMLEPAADVWEHPAWPAELAAPDDMQRWLGLAKDRLQPEVRPTICRSALKKQGVMNEMGQAARSRTAAVPQTIAWSDGRTSAGVARKACEDCGDCFTGCNVGAKVSLDTSLLVEARRAGFTIVSGAVVSKVKRVQASDRWLLEVVHTDPEMRKRLHRLDLHASNVVLAAGTFGSTEILMRSAAGRTPLNANGLHLSKRLGTGFSGNGDLLVAMADANRETGAQADEGAALRGRDVGPTIVSCLDRRGDPTDPFVVQDLSPPGSLVQLTREAVALSACMDRLGKGDDSEHGARDDDPLATGDKRQSETMLLAVIGHDAADGELRLTGRQAREGSDADGNVTVHWPHAKEDPRLSKRFDQIAGWLAPQPSPGALAATLLANPLWRLLPAQLESYLGRTRGPMITVHPLGGCPMGHDVASGVVDSFGRVFRAPDPAVDADESKQSENPVHVGLWVLDGSIVPTSLGINPALTISALALRGAGELIRQLGLTPREPPLLTLEPRPVFKVIDVKAVPPPPVRTRVEVIERLSGPVTMAGRDLHAELTLRYEPVVVRNLHDPDPSKRKLCVAASASRLRVFETSTWNKLEAEPWEEKDDAHAEWIAPVLEGRLGLFRRDASSACQRRRRAVLPWARNRGVRDIWHYLSDQFLDWALSRPVLDAEAPSWTDRIRGIWRLLTLAGERRELHYSLRLGPAEGGRHPSAGPAAAFDITGSKWLTYNCRANPWKQLTQLTLTQSPFGGSPRLALDRHFLVRRGLPLLRIVEQNDQPTALMDLAAFGLYAFRQVLSTHTWSFRLPDAPIPRTIDRLPGRVKGLPLPQIQEVAVDRGGSVLAPAVSLRLTRYPNPGKRPVLLIHGYSSSGVAFAHHSIPTSLARHLHDEGWDVWIVDLRTSSGLPSARDPWTFEQVGYEDIPLAVDRVVRSTGHEQIDVVAHCMGSAMLCMGLLGDYDAPSVQPDPFAAERKLLPRRIRRLVMMQVGPLTLFSEDNVFRAYVMRYLRHYLGLEHYAFRPEGEPTLKDQLIDRLLSTLPYPDDEYDVENPWLARRPWVSTRHRMDALYGRDFALANMPRKVLAHIDDHFGPLNIETVAQTVHFTLSREIADTLGDRRFVSPERVRERMGGFPVLSLHGGVNGLADARTADLLEDFFCAKLKLGNFRRQAIPGYGHQDCLVGERAALDVFPRISGFLKGQEQEAS